MDSIPDYKTSLKKFKIIEIKQSHSYHSGIKFEINDRITHVKSPNTWELNKPHFFISHGPKKQSEEKSVCISN